MSTNPSRLERRSGQRFGVHSPVAVHFDGRTVPGFTQDISGRGIFFYAEAVLPPGTVVELTFMMPAEITLAESMPVRCCGRVLRLSASIPSLTGQRAGVAVKLDAYDYLPANQPSMSFARVSAASVSAGSIAR